MRCKKLVALLLALGTCFAVAACDDDQSTSTPDSGSTSVSSSASAGDSVSNSSSSSSSTTPVVVTTVTATEWVDALDMEGETNWSCNTTMQQVTNEGTVQQTQLVEFDGATIHVMQKVGDVVTLETFYYKEGDNYFSIYDGTKYDSTKDEYEGRQKTGVNDIFAFEQFTYDETAKAYKAAEITHSYESGGTTGTETYTDVVVKFEDGRFTYYSMTMSAYGATIVAEATVTYGETETITLPTLA